MARVKVIHDVTAYIYKINCDKPVSKWSFQTKLEEQQKPSCRSYSAKRNRRLYPLRVLKQCGAPPDRLAKVYTTIVRPVLEYAAPVWQNIPDFLSYKIESIQKGAMRIIFPLMNYNEAFLKMPLI